MPQIFDNIELKLLEGLHAVLPAATASSFCVGYLNLRRDLKGNFIFGSPPLNVSDWGGERPRDERAWKET
jgi:hypothetical protein